MQKDFHYYCIGILARAAGFNSRDALIIAYASQYVDDATESKPITLVDEEDKLRLKFDPVRTAYFGLKASEWSIHKRVYIPFHFIPPLPFQYTDPACYFDTPNFVTEPDSPFAKTLLRKACQEKNEKRRLCRIGVALHTYADTWAHQGFSGRSSKEENGVEEIDIWDKGDWQPERFTDWIIELITEIFAEELGHGEAGLLPDLSFLKWRYTKKSGEQIPERDNQGIFYEAAKTIYNELREINGLPEMKKSAVKPILWEEIQGPIADLFADRGSLGSEISLLEKLKLLRGKEFLEERCEKWKKEFRHYFDRPSDYWYDRTKWRELALNPRIQDPEYDAASSTWEDDWEEWGEEFDEYEGLDRSPWEEYAQEFDYDIDFDYDEESIAWDDWDEKKFERRARFLLKPSFPDSLWVHFHRAALQQRHLILEHLP